MEDKPVKEECLVIELTPKDQEELLKFSDRCALIADIADILALFQQLKRHTHLDSINRASVLLMHDSLDMVLNDVASCKIPHDKYDKVRELIKQAYKLYPTMRSTYTEAVKEAEEEVKKPFINWTPVIIGLVLVLGIVYFF